MTSTRRNPTVIGYIHKLSPLRKGKKALWCEFELQMEKERKRVVCFSKSKYDILAEKEKTLTAIQISNYLVGPGWNSSKEEFRMNDMTVITAAKPSQYNFQYVPDAEPDIVTLKDVQEKVDVGSKVLIKGVVKKGQAVQKVGSKNLRMLRSTISDSSCTLFLTLWESEIDVIEDGKVYIFSNVSVRQNEQNKTLSTTRNTISSRVDNDEMEELDNTLAEEMLNENKQNVLTVKSFRSVEVDKYHTCVHCKKKVVPGVQGKIIKCTSCPHRMRFADCKIDIACRVYVKISDNENDETLVLTIFTDVLQQILTTNVIALTEDEISEKLLELENIRIVFGNDNIVMECTFQL